jgi:hypothetical protein
MTGKTRQQHIFPCLARRCVDVGLDYRFPSKYSSRTTSELSLYRLSSFLSSRGKTWLSDTALNQFYITSGNVVLIASWQLPGFNVEQQKLTRQPRLCDIQPIEYLCNSVKPLLLVTHTVVLFLMK